MASSVRIDGSLPAAGTNPSTGTVFAGGWAVDYDWHNDRVAASGQPRRLSALRFPAPFDLGVEGVLRGQAAFTGFLYLFQDGQYLKLREADMTPVQEPRPTAPAWHLPPSWTSFDAVFPGGGVKSRFAYFFRGDEYVRFDWTTDHPSPGYPRKIGPNWHTSAPFTSDIDGVIIGQEGFSTKAYLFKTVTVTVDDSGALGAGHTLQVPVYARYDFDKEIVDHVVQDPLVVVANWRGLFPLLDAGTAVDTALGWTAPALIALGAKAASLTAGTPSDPATDAALRHHFMSPNPNATMITAITARMNDIQNRIRAIPSKFQWTPGLAFDAQTARATLTEIGDTFSTESGPNARGAVHIHEASHFIETGSPVDVPEWQGETVNGTFNPAPAGQPAYHDLTPDQALTNPSSYAAFAQEIAFGQDTRFGAGRPQE